MKANKIWLVILVILVAGTWSTSYTKKYVESARMKQGVEVSETLPDAKQAGQPKSWTPEAAMKKPSTAAETAKQAGADGAFAGGSASTAEKSEAGMAGNPAAGQEALAADGATPVMAAAAPIADENAMAEARTADGSENAWQEGAVAESSADSGGAGQTPAAAMAAMEPGQSSGRAAAVGDTAQGRAAAVGDAVQGRAAAGTETAQVNPYQSRLEELDAQIAKNHAAAADTTANYLKATADGERKLWDTEMNRILDALEQQFSAEQREALFQEQKEWIRDRENTAVTASKKQSGSAMEEVEYNISLAETTRTRAYELAQQYAAVLAEADR